MLWKKSDHKKYGFVLVLYLFRDISSFESEKGDSIKLSRTSFLYKQRREILVPLDCKRFILTRNTKFLEFWFTYRSHRNVILF